VPASHLQFTLRRDTNATSHAYVEEGKRLIKSVSSFLQSADVWAVGVMLFRMVVGKYPFERMEDRLDPQRMNTMADVSYTLPVFKKCVKRNQQSLPCAARDFQLATIDPLVVSACCLSLFV
jgi:hypothetical protein